MNQYSIGEKVLEMRNVSLSFSGVPILRQLDADIYNIQRPGMQQGQVVCLLGPSGVGKTQFFRILAGLQKPDAGTVLLGDGLVPVQAGMVGVVDQSYTLFPWRKVLGNLVVAGIQRGLSKDDSEKKASDLLEKFGVSHIANSYPRKISGGQRQRVAIVQQMMCSSHYLLMDEPFSGLDILAKSKACNLITSLSQVDELNTCVITTHDIETAVAVADTIWLMGRDRDANGVSLGARIVEKYDLAAMGLAWHEDIRDLEGYGQVVKEIYKSFPKL
jgi:polar amino acid transport system ATP-binding protein/sulfate transport system ATP-binding protein